MTECVSFWWKAYSARRFAGFIVLAFFAWNGLPTVLIAQSSQNQAELAQRPSVPDWQTAAGGKMEFDVASVRPSVADARIKGNEYLTPYDGGSLSGAGLFSANAPLASYIVFAYKILDLSLMKPIFERFPEIYDIEARAEGNPTKDQLRLMMQSLLEDRFKLKYHREIQQGSVYALTFDKPGKLGSQLRRHPENSPCLEKTDKANPPSDGSAPPPYCGFDAWRVKGNLHMRMIDVSMDQIASFLGGMAGSIGGRTDRPVIDETGLAGKFDIDIEFKKDEGDLNIDSDASGPTFTAALKEQLGLKLVAAKGTKDAFVVDHIERPSAN
jgi:uncharacterized protein (TIGR03435 family)